MREAFDPLALTNRVLEGDSDAFQPLRDLLPAVSFEMLVCSPAILSVQCDVSFLLSQLLDLSLNVFLFFLGPEQCTSLKVIDLCLLLLDLDVDVYFEEAFVEQITKRGEIYQLIPASFDLGTDHLVEVRTLQGNIKMLHKHNEV